VVATGAANSRCRRLLPWRRRKPDPGARRSNAGRSPVASSLRCSSASPRPHHTFRPATLPDVSGIAAGSSATAGGSDAGMECVNRDEGVDDTRDSDESESVDTSYGITVTGRLSPEGAQDL